MTTAHDPMTTAPAATPAATRDPGPDTGGPRRPPPARRRRPGRFLLWASATWLVLLALAALGADWIPGLPHYTEKIGAFAQPPDPTSVGGLLGTDGVGRSNLSRIIYGSRISLIIAVCSTTLGLLIGLVVGMAGGYYRRAAEAGSTIIANMISALPPLILLLALVAAMGATLPGITFALGFVISELFIRIVKGAVIANATSEYVLAARTLGASDLRILLKEILPNLVPVLASVIPMAILIVVEGSLSFLGYGIPPPNPSWGGMIAAGADLVRDFPYVLAGPVVTLFLTVFSFNTVGDHLGARSDVREAQL